MATVESLAKAVGVSAVPANYDDLDALAGSWIEDPAVDRTLAGFGKVDQELWK